MIIEIILTIVGIIAGWLITHVYYKKALEDQEKEASKQISEYIKLINEQSNNTKEFLKLKYIEQAITEYKKASTPVKLIDSLNIPVSEKADIYDAVMIRVKGRLGKSNKYRE